MTYLYIGVLVLIGLDFYLGKRIHLKERPWWCGPYTWEIIRNMFDYPKNWTHNLYHLRGLEHDLWIANGFLCFTNHDHPEKVVPFNLLSRRALWKAFQYHRNNQQLDLEK